MTSSTHVRRLPLEPGEPERLEIEWVAIFLDVVVRFDGVEVARVAKISPGEPLTIRTTAGDIVLSRRDNELDVTLGGRHLPGSFGHPHNVTRRTARLAIFTVLAQPAISFGAWFMFHVRGPPPPTLPTWAVVVAVAAVPISIVAVVGLRRRSGRLVQLAGYAIFVVGLVEFHLLGDFSLSGTAYLMFSRLIADLTLLGAALRFAAECRRSVSGGASPVAVNLVDDGSSK